MNTHRWLNNLLSFTLIISPALACGQEKILFIGNSLTYFNAMPTIFDSLCLANKKRLSVSTSTYPGVSLLQHIAGYADKIKHTTHSDIVMWHRAKAGDTTRNELIHLLTHNPYNYIYLQDRSGDEDSVEYAIKYIKHLAPKACLFHKTKIKTKNVYLTLYLYKLSKKAIVCNITS